MDFYDKSVEFAIDSLKTDKINGLSAKKASENLARFKYNQLTKKKKTPFVKRIVEIIKEPMLLILIFSLAIALGTGIGQFLKTGNADFSESFGILGAISLSVVITLIMEGSSEKAFNALSKIYDNTPVKVIRDGVVLLISAKLLTVGDIVLMESGDKIVADGRLIETNQLSIDESALTGESLSSEKDAKIQLNIGTPLAERKNSVYSGTFVTSGNGKMVVTAIGDQTEIGKIASGLKEKKQVLTPLEQKMSKLGKTITIIGTVASALVFLISVIRLGVTGALEFNNVQELFISSVILIVAAVPEGLPTIVAVSLALNMIKLAKENALIRKMIASETAGAVSVICSDKTGTLTQNKMKVESICGINSCFSPSNRLNEYFLENFICNSTAKAINKNGEYEFFGNQTECALLECLYSNGKRTQCESYKQKYKQVDREPFSSQTKVMITSIEVDGKVRKLIKGAPEKVIKMVNLSEERKEYLMKEISNKQKLARRIICFAHDDGEGYLFDGYVSIVDPIRKEVKKAIEECKNAGIKIKMLTGDNMLTAYAVASELKIAGSVHEVANAVDLEKLDDQAFMRALSKISVIARSTPSMKLRVVKALKQAGEVVAVTGDGINDAPAIKHADVGIAMGKSGSEITKEASDVILLDDSFTTVVKAVAFGRNVYKNLQRFITFQLSVNLSALFFIMVTVILGLEAPFNTFQLLWINLIMDGPPALTLGMESASANLMKSKPVRREDGIVSKTMLFKIIFYGVIMGGVVLLQHLTNFLNVGISERRNVVFTLFILFQLFNAFNCRELGGESIFKGFNKNKIMALTFVGVFLSHIIMVQFLPKIFNLNPMSLSSFIKVTVVALGIIVVSETLKAVYRWVRKIKPIKIFVRTNDKLMKA